jgi:heme-degrading monooxygenase HmoA
MILELATFSIRPEAMAAFEASFAQASQVIARAPGHLGHAMHRSVDEPGRYTLLVRWQTREDHTIGFRQSELFKQWRGLLQEHFAAAPVVDHLEALTDQDSSS